LTLPLCNPPGDKQKRPERGCRAGAFSWRRRSTPPSFPFKVSAHVPRCGGDLIHYINESFDGGCDALAHAGRNSTKSGVTSALSATLLAVVS
jgi:hypothetical protein